MEARTEVCSRNPPMHDHTLMLQVLYMVGLNSQIPNNHMESESVGDYENQLQFGSMEVLNRPKKKDPCLSTDGNLILIFIMTRSVTGGTGITGPDALEMS
ncbi:hypothetical protein CTI12_AA228190 [Artemisia annua]|uniref:Uncharacterized protein n=1 Tax=Artemisia annua TaxID=35608 RepID=A0A2U1NUC3_ARTAN|nr:hypothetical protein CTI12_AA228190 [Artemisia annua]